jgi:hypothetical protein
VSQRAFQTLAARLVVEPDFRGLVCAGGAAALERESGGSLTELESRRLLAVAADPGLDATRLVHFDFRLSKLYVMLPLTRFLLGRERMLREAHAFWRASPPVTHYFIKEAVDFCDHLQERLRTRALRARYLAEVLAYERAELELKRPRPGGRAPRPRLVPFRHDPRALLSALARGRRPRAIPLRACTLVATLDTEGNVRWDIQEDEAKPERDAPDNSMRPTADTKRR